VSMSRPAASWYVTSMSNEQRQRMCLVGWKGRDTESRLKTTCHYDGCRTARYGYGFHRMVLTAISAAFTTAGTVSDCLSIICHTININV